MDRRRSCSDCDHMTRNPQQNVTADHSPNRAPHCTRSTLAQCFATFVNSLSYMSLGLMYTISTVVIENLKDAKSGLSLNDEQISWYVSLLPIFQPFGCLLGGLLQNYIGRKHGLFLMNASTVTAWILLYKAVNVEMLYLSSILMGISIGFAEAPCVTYVSEITTPKLRGTLVSYNNSNVTFGITLTFLLTSFVNWRASCLVCMGLSIFSVILLILIPDSPVWLINKGRTEDAIKALRWLRGWVSEEDVIQEYEELSQFIKKSYSNNTINRSNDDDEASRPRKQKFKISYLLEKSTLRPFIFLNCYTFFANAASLQGARNYFLVMFNELNLPVTSKWLAFVNGLASLIGSFTCSGTVSLYGKRRLSLASMISSAFLTLMLGLYILLRHDLNRPWIFVILFILLGFTSGGISNVPWVLLGEIFPIKTRSVAAGVTGATFYVLFSIYIKTFYHLQVLITTPGVYLLYSVLGFIGTIYLWIYMAETEGKSMNEIEELFKDDARTSCSHFRKKK